MKKTVRVLKRAAHFYFYNLYRLCLFLARSPKTHYQNYKRLPKKFQRFVAMTMTFVTVFVGTGLIYLFVPGPWRSQVEAVWFDDAWLYRKPITITNSGTNQTNYQIKLSMDTATLITNNKMKSDCSDIRVTDINGDMLNHWIETGANGCNTATTAIWTKVPTITTSGATVYIYYGNPAAKFIESGSMVFEFFDDFSEPTLNSSRWTSSGTVTLTNGTAVIGSTSQIRSTSNFQYKSLDFRMTTTAGDDINHFLEAAGFENSGNTEAAIIITDSTTTTQIASRTIAASTGNKNSAATVTSRTSAQNYRIKRTDATEVRFYQNDTQFNSGSPDTTNVSTSNLEVEFSTTGTYTATVDFVFVRSTASTEPSAGAAGTEEKANAPVAYWKFDEGQGSTAYDSSRNSSTLETIAYDAASSDTGSSVSTDSWSHTVGTGQNRVLIVTSSFTSTNTISSITYAGQALTSVGSQTNTGDVRVEMWRLVNPPSGTNTITITYSGSTTHVSGASSWSGVNQLSPTGTWASSDNGGTSSTAPEVSVTSATGEYIVAVLGAAGVPSNSTGKGQTEIYNTTVSTTFRGSGSYLGGIGGSLRMRWYLGSSSQYAAGGVSLKPANSINNGAVHTETITLQNSVTDTDSSTPSFTCSGQNRILIYHVGVWIGDSVGNITSVTYNGVALTKLEQVYNYANTGGYGEVWYLLNPPEGSYTISATGDTAGITYMASCWSGVNQQMPFGNVVKHESSWGGAPDYSTNITTVPGDMVIDSFHALCNETAAVGSGQVVVAAAVTECNSKLYASYEIATSTSTTMDWTNITVDARIVQLLFTLKPAGNWQGEDLCISGKCIKYDGTNDNIRLTDRDQLDFAASDIFSISAWVKHSGTISSTNDYIITKATSGTYTGYKLYMDDSGDFCFTTRDGTNAEDSACTSGVDFDDNQWHYVVGVKNGTTTNKLYVDGTLRATDSSIASTGTLANSNDFYFGVDIDGASNYWVGFIDEAKVKNYQTAPSDNQIAADYVARGTSEATAVLGATNQPNALSNGLVGYWKMDESSWNGTTGEVLDYSGIGNNGTRAGNATTATGKFKNGGTLDGTGDWINVGSVSSANLGAGNFTLCSWIKTSASEEDIIANGAVSSDGHYLLMEYNGKLRGHIRYSGNLNTLDGTSTINDGNWHHGCQVVDNTTINIYVDGKLETSATLSGTKSGTTGTLIIGNRDTSSGTNNFNGQLDETRIYNRALSSKDISQLYDFAPGPVGYWRFDEKTSQSVVDSTGNNTNGTLGATTASGETNDPVWGQGRFGSGLTFASQDYVAVPNQSALNITSDWTIQAWIKTTAATGGVFYGIIEKNASADRNYNMYVAGSDGKVYAGYNNGSNFYSRASDVAVNDGQWHFVVGQYNDSDNSLKVYVDGVLSSTAASGTPGNADTSTGNLCIGTNDCGGGNGDQFIGSIDEVKIYNYMRTSKQVVEDMNLNHPAPGSPVGSALGYWKFDEGVFNTCSGGSNDTCNSGSGGSVIDGSETSTPTWTNSAKYGKALTFNGSTNYINIGSASIIDDIPTIGGTSTPKGGMTISAWIYPTSEGETSNGAIIHKASNNSPASGWIFRFQGSQTNALEFSADYTSTDIDAYTSDNAVTLNAWNYVTLTWDGSSESDNIHIYVNGIEKTSSRTDASGNYQSDASSSMNIGGVAGNSTFAGSIDEVKLYASVLTTEQIKADMNQGSNLVLGALSDKTGSGYEGGSRSANQEYCVPGDSSTCTEPTGEWKLDEKSGTTAFDTSGNSRNGTYSGPPYAIPTPGKVGSARQFSGSTNQIITTSTGISSVITNSAGTMSVWIKPTGSSPSQTNSYDGNPIVVDTGQVTGIYRTNASATCDTYTGDKIYVVNFDGDFDCVGVSYTANEWVHITWLHTGGNLYLYKNGVLVGSTASGNTTLFTGNIQFGGLGSVYANATIDNIKTYNYARTDAQIAWDYNRGGPVGWWKFDECQGTTAYDASGNGNNGTINFGGSGNTSVGDCSTSSATAMWYNGRSGKLNSSLDFDGSNDYVTMGDPSSGILDFSTNTFSLSAWIKTTDANGGVIGKYSGNTSYFLDLVSGNARFFTRNSGGTQALATSANTVNDGNWHHIVGVRDGTNVIIYVDGTNRGSAAQGSIDVSSSGNFVIGDQDTAQIYPLDGQIDDVRVFSYGLTPVQVKNLMNEGAVRFGPSAGQP